MPLFASSESRYRRLGRQAIGGAGWGLFFVVAPIIEVLVAVVWMPVLIACEWIRSRRYGFIPGAAVRLAVVGMIVAAAAHAPVKSMSRYLDQPVGPFPAARMTGEDPEARPGPSAVDGMERQRMTHHLARFQGSVLPYSMLVELPDAVLLKSRVLFHGFVCPSYSVQQLQRAPAATLGILRFRCTQASALVKTRNPAR